MTETVKERKNAALSASAQQAMEELTKEFPFAEGRDAARFAVAYAISRNLPLERSSLGPLTGTNWNVATLDPDGKLAELIRLTWPDQADAYFLLETLMNVGMTELGKKLAENPALRLSELLSAEASE
jgi:hypothetical protein